MINKALTLFLLRPQLAFENSILSTLRISPSTTKTAATDCMTIILYNPDFFKSLTLKEVLSVFAHEIYHKALRHNFRRQNRDPQYWNICTDYEVNAALHQCNFPFQLPGKPLSIEEYKATTNQEDNIYFYDPIFKTDQTMTAEKLYDDLIKSRPPSPPGMILDLDPSLEASTFREAAKHGITKAQLDAETTQQIQQAASQSQSLSSILTANIKPPPPVPWRSILYQYLRPIYDRSDWSLRRPNRQAMQNGFILPTLHNPATPALAVAVDTSGSCLKYLDDFTACIKAIAHSLKPSALTVIYTDSDICQVDKLKPRDYHSLKLNPKGGGGTSFKPALSYDHNPACLIYLTDLYGDFPDKPPSYPVLWVSPENDSPKPPFGRLITLI